MKPCKCIGFLDIKCDISHRVFQIFVIFCIHFYTMFQCIIKMKWLMQVLFQHTAGAQANAIFPRDRRTWTSVVLASDCKTTLSPTMGIICLLTKQHLGICKKDPIPSINAGYVWKCIVYSTYSPEFPGLQQTKLSQFLSNLTKCLITFPLMKSLFKYG